MATIVTVTDKYRVVIPQSVRDQLGVAIGDVLEVKAEKGKIVLEPRSGVDHAIAEGLSDVEKGRVYGPFATVDQMLGSLKGAAKKRERSRRSR